MRHIDSGTNLWVVGCIVIGKQRGKVAEKFLLTSSANKRNIFLDVAYSCGGAMRRKEEMVVPSLQERKERRSSMDDATPPGHLVPSVAVLASTYWQVFSLLPSCFHR